MGRSGVAGGMLVHASFLHRGEIGKIILAEEEPT